MRVCELVMWIFQGWQKVRPVSVRAARHHGPPERQGQDGQVRDDLPAPPRHQEGRQADRGRPLHRLR